MLKVLHESVGAHVGEPGTDKRAFKVTEDKNQVNSLPFAVRFLNCEKQNARLCNSEVNQYRSECWIDRNDVIPPKQNNYVGGRAGWHYGFRTHQLIGRRKALVLLEATQLALQTWKAETSKGNIPLPEKHWHMSDYYEGIKKRISLMDDGPCEEILAFLKRICKTSLYGRTEYTPRYNPNESSIRSIMLPAKNGYIPSVGKDVIYEPPDVAIPSLLVPEGSLDVRAVVSASNTPLVRNLNVQERRRQHLQLDDPYDVSDKDNRSLEKHILIQPGLGVHLYNHMSGFCDGSSNSFCNRDNATDCLLSGHNDARSGLIFDPFSGWIVVKVSDLRHGIIVAKLDLLNFENVRTKGWKKENDSINRRSLRTNNEESLNISKKDGYSELQFRRNLNLPPGMGTFLHPDCKLQYAVNGDINTLEKANILELKQTVARAVMLYPILDDENYSGPQEVEIAMRMTGCDQRNGGTYRLTHLYWA